MRTALIAVITAFLSLSMAQAKATSSGSHTSHTRASKARSSGHNRNYCTACARDSRGRIKRDPEAARAFKQSHPCPATGRSTGACPGYVIDHVKPLKRGGADKPENMQWQTKAEAKAKDRVE
jgi:hypothetical protein